MLYRYVKAFPRSRHYFRWLSLGLTSVGLVLLANVLLPIFVYQVQTRALKPKIISPLANQGVLGMDSALLTDLSQANQWFSSSPSLPAWKSRITHYNLSIPELKIENAVVQIGGNDLGESLIHYSGTALPGQYGNAVVFGHSVLPQFFNPKKYKTIFSTLPSLEKGDEILVDFDGVLYRYRVIEMVEVSPQDISVLEQRYDAEYLSLITCVPPGTYLRRLVIRARLARL